MTKKQMAAAFTAATALFVMTGCGVADRLGAGLTGYSTMCVKETGVKYLQFASGAAPMVDLEGKPVPCTPK